MTGAQHSDKSDRLRVYQAATVLMLLMFVAAVIGESFAVPQLSLLTHQISEYANTKTGWILTIGFVCWSASFAGMALMTSRVDRFGGRRAFTSCFVIATAATLLLALFHTDTVAGKLPLGRRLTTAGQLHDVGSGVTTLVLFCSAVVGSVVSRDRRLRLSSAAAAVAAISVDLGLLAAGAGVGGLRERLLLAIGCLWQLVYLATLRRDTSARQPVL